MKCGAWWNIKVSIYGDHELGRNKFQELKHAETALLLLLFSAANARWHVLRSVQSAQNSLSLVHVSLC